MPRTSSSERALRACMQILVLVNLVFVLMTGTAGLQWIAPLLVLTLAAPLLERFREKLLYTLLWNAGVLCFFLVLLRHAMRADLAYVRESGLVLAVLCQVHLLNNLRSNQRPDLLFFNAFLIAIITGFMNRGVGFPLAFLVFAPCFVVGLQLLSATRGGRALPEAVTRRFVIDGVRRAAVVLVASLLVFVFWPRDFDRKPFFHGKIDVNSGGPAQLEIGFNEELVLGRNEPVIEANRPALRVRLVSGARDDVPTLWRGATLESTGGGTWHPIGPGVRRKLAPLDERWQGRRGRLARPGPSGAASPTGPRLEVVRLGQGTERLFAPLEARLIELETSQAGVLLRPRLDGTIDAAETDDVHYELSLDSPSRAALRGRHPRELSPEIALYTELPQTERVERARSLAHKLAARLPEDAQQHEVVQLINDHLSRSYGYLAPGAEGAAESLEGFLSGEAGGHCEYFASALASMLRSLRIPCRVVTGYRSTRWDDQGVLAFGTRDAHAWVEVFDPGAGWYAVDPSPSLAEYGAATNLLARLRSRTRAAWQTVTSFDDARRAAVFGWLRGLPSGLGDAFSRRPLLSSFACLLSLGAAAGILRRRHLRTEPSIRAYRRSLRGARLRLEPGETPRELVLRARSEGLEPGALARLELATSEHEAARYAGEAQGHPAAGVTRA